MAANRGLALLIVVATVLFVVGVSIEKGDEDEHAEPTGIEEAQVEGVGKGEGEEAHAEEVTEAGEEEESLLGINTESTGLIVLAVASSLLLAAAVWLRPKVGWLLGLVARAMVAFAALDVREAIHQADESESALAVLAVIVALLHLGAGGWALRLSRVTATS